jgi:non-ribosomal peptide synthetase component F
MIVAILGTLKAGKIYVPLEPALPPNGSPTCSATRGVRW